jgi:hypothetical protein
MGSQNFRAVFITCVKRLEFKWTQKQKQKEREYLSCLNTQLCIEKIYCCVSFSLWDGERERETILFYF